MSAHVPAATSVFQLRVDCGPPVPIGAMQGGKALMIPILGGLVSGPRLSGEVLPGGADWAVIRPHGLVVVNAHYAIRANDGTIIQISNRATNRLVAGAHGAPSVMLTTPTFSAPDGAHEWLNQGVFVGTLTPEAGGQQTPVHIGIYQMSWEPYG